MGRLPKVGGQLADPRPERTLQWTTLPAQHDVEPPTLPKWREWNPETLTWWSDLWRRPQASQWEPSGMSLWILAALMDDLITGAVEPRKVSGEIRQHEDRHGLGAKAMLALRWRFETEPVTTPVLPADQVSSEARRRRLRVIQDGGGAA